MEAPTQRTETVLAEPRQTNTPAPRKAVKPSALPYNLPPLGIRREQAAELIGVSASHFDTMVVDGLMPKPTKVGRRRIWNRTKVEQAFFRLDDDFDEKLNQWDQALEGLCDA